jgi:hypothetical protein
MASLLSGGDVPIWILQEGITAAGTAEVERTAIPLLGGHRVVRTDLHAADRVCHCVSHAITPSGVSASNLVDGVSLQVWILVVVQSWHRMDQRWCWWSVRSDTAGDVSTSMMAEVNPAVEGVGAAAAPREDRGNRLVESR